MAERPQRGRLQGQRLLVLGGSSGIGLATAQAAADEGACIVLAARSASRLDAARGELAGEGHAVLALDARQHDGLGERLAPFGPIDHLLLSVGTGGPPPAPFPSCSIDDARESFEAHYWTAVAMMQAAWPIITRHARSSITIVTGGIARRAIAGKAFTASYQHALEGLARALVDELAPVRVNVVAPGLVDTPLWDAVAADLRDAMFRKAAAENPVGFVPDADPVGRAICDLIANPYISGATLTVDGGWSMSHRIVAA